MPSLRNLTQRLASLTGLAALGLTTLAALLGPSRLAHAQTTSTTPPPASSGPAEVEILDLAAWLRGEGAGLTADEVARLALESAPSMDSARAATRQARAAAARAYLGFFPRFEITARYTRLSPVTNGGLSSGVTPEQEALLRGLVAGVEDPESAALFNVNLESQLALANFSFPVILDQFSIGGTLTYPVSDVFFAVRPGAPPLILAVLHENMDLMRRVRGRLEPGGEG